MRFASILFFFLIACNNKGVKKVITDATPTQKEEVVTAHTNKGRALEEKVQTLNLYYIQWACECANWAPEADRKMAGDTGSLSESTVFVEPAKSSLVLPDTIGYQGDVVQFTGQFYKEKTYYEGYVKGEQEVDEARVFRYTNYKIIKSHHHIMMEELESFKRTDYLKRGSRRIVADLHLASHGFSAQLYIFSRSLQNLKCLHRSNPKDIVRSSSFS